MASQIRRKCLVVSREGGGNALIGQILEGMDISPVPSGSGQEGEVAIGHHKPDLIIIFFSPRNEEDIKVLRAAQKFSAAMLVVISPDAQAPQSLLGPTNGHFCYHVLTDALALGQLREALTAPSKKTTPAKAVSGSQMVRGKATSQAILGR